MISKLLKADLARNISERSFESFHDNPEIGPSQNGAKHKGLKLFRQVAEPFKNTMNYKGFWLTFREKAQKVLRKPYVLKGF